MRVFEPLLDKRVVGRYRSWCRHGHPSGEESGDFIQLCHEFCQLENNGHSWERSAGLLWTKSERGGKTSHHLLVLLDIQSSFDDEVLLFLLRRRLLLLPRVTLWFNLREWLRRRSLLARCPLGGKRHGNLQHVGSAATSCWLASDFLWGDTLRLGGSVAVSSCVSLTLELWQLRTANETPELGKNSNTAKCLWCSHEVVFQTNQYRGRLQKCHGNTLHLHISRRNILGSRHDHSW